MLYANQFLFSDIYPFEVVKKVSDITMDIREMSADLQPETDPYEQKYKFSSNENNQTVRIRKNNKGVWRDKDGRRYVIGNEPRKYHDYCF